MKSTSWPFFHKNDKNDAQQALHQFLANPHDANLQKQYEDVVETYVCAAIPNDAIYKNKKIKGIEDLDEACERLVKTLGLPQSMDEAGVKSVLGGIEEAHLANQVQVTQLLYDVDRGRKSTSHKREDLDNTRDESCILGHFAQTVNHVLAEQNDDQNLDDYELGGLACQLL